MEVECVVTHPPCDCALFASGRGLVGLTLDAQVHDVIPANGAVVHNDVPGPQGHGVPFLHLEPEISSRASGVRGAKRIAGIAIREEKKSRVQLHCNNLRTRTRTI